MTRARWKGSYPLGSLDVLDPFMQDKLHYLQTLAIILALHSTETRIGVYTRVFCRGLVYTIGEDSSEHVILSPLSTLM